MSSLTRYFRGSGQMSSARYESGPNPFWTDTEVSYDSDEYDNKKQ